MILVVLNEQVSEEDGPRAAGCLSFATYSYMLKQAPLVPRDAPRATPARQPQAEPFS